MTECFFKKRFEVHEKPSSPKPEQSSEGERQESRREAFVPLAVLCISAVRVESLAIGESLSIVRCFAAPKGQRYTK